MKRSERIVGKLFFTCVVGIAAYADESTHSIGWLLVTGVVLLVVWLSDETISDFLGLFKRTAADKAKSNQDD